MKYTGNLFYFQKGANYPCLDISDFAWTADNQENAKTTPHYGTMTHSNDYFLLIKYIKVYSRLSFVFHSVLFSFLECCAKFRIICCLILYTKSKRNIKAFASKYLTYITKLINKGCLFN